MDHLAGSTLDANLTDDPGNANFRSPIRMHNVVAMGFGVSNKD